MIFIKKYNIIYIENKKDIKSTNSKDYFITILELEVVGSSPTPNEWVAQRAERK